MIQSNVRRVVILAADLFEDRELLYPLYRLREEGMDVKVASLDGGPTTGLKGHGPLKADMHVGDVEEREFDCLVIPGGFAPDAFRVNPDVLELTRAFHASSKPIAFICHAGWVPISAGILEGRKATSYIAIKDDMVNAGCDWKDEETVVDGNLISARHPNDLGAWCRAIVAALDST